jgi:3-methylcrotonyl-CoA carboxylase alpha subunit
MHYRYQHRGRIYNLNLERHGEGYRARVDGGEVYDLEVLDSQPGELSLRFAGRPITLYWAADGSSKWVSLAGCTYCLEKPAARAARPGGQSSEDRVRAPMPAQVRAIETAQAEAVEKGQTLLVLEAMKMEIRIKAPRAGQVQRLHVQEGQTVEKDQLLVEIGDR